MGFLQNRFIKEKFYRVLANCEVYNKSGEMFPIMNIKNADYGYEITLGTAPGLSYESLQKRMSEIQDSFPCLIEYNISRLKGTCTVSIITKAFNHKTFEIVPIKHGHNLFLGNGVNGIPVITDFHELSHLLIAGMPGSGKSRLLFCILFCLVYGTNLADLYLTQIDKHDLHAFRKFKCVKGYAETLEETYEMFNIVLQEAIRIDHLIKERDIYDVRTYNKRYPESWIKTIILAADELGTFIPSASDDDETTEMKRACVSTIQRIQRIGRSSGVFVIGCLQRATADQLDPTMKFLFNNKICFNMNTISSNNCIESPIAKGQGTGEAIYFNGADYKRILVPWINDDLIDELSNGNPESCNLIEDTESGILIPKKEPLGFSWKRKEVKLSPEETAKKLKMLELEREADKKLNERKAMAEVEKVALEAAAVKDYSNAPKPKPIPEITIIDQTVLPPIGQLERARRNNRGGRIND